jgi:glycosyltransferase involved in cell wall biosynthesis
VSTRRRVALDAGALIGARTGIGVFTHELAAGLAAHPDVDLVAYAPTWRGRHQLTVATPRPATVVTRPLPARPLRALWRRVPVPPVEWFCGAVDVVHGPNYVVPPTRRAAAVVSVHDLTMVHFPEMCTADTRAVVPLIAAAVRRGAWVHTDTDAVAAEVVDVFGADPARVRTVPLAPSPTPEPSPEAVTWVDTLTDGEPFVLALGTVEPRKDLVGLIHAFERLAADLPEVRLVVAGPDGWGADALAETIAASSARTRIVRVGWVDADQRAALLSGAAVLAYPSRYEGFGLPPLEAMAVGTPVVATDVPAVAETCGDAVVLVPTGDPEALADALRRVVVDEDAVAQRLRTAGPAHAAGFTWERTVAGMVALYDEAAAQRATR